MPKTVTKTLPDPVNSSQGLSFTIVNRERDGVMIPYITVCYAPDPTVTADVFECWFDELAPEDQMAVGDAGNRLRLKAMVAMGYTE
jgi:hypothetical protein